MATSQDGHILKISTTYSRLFYMVQTDHFTPKTGVTPTVQLSKAGTNFAAAAGVVSEIGSGWYRIGLTAVDTNTEGDLAFIATAAAADVANWTDQVVIGLPISSSIKKNFQTNVLFAMTDSVTHLLKVGAFVTATRSLDGAAPVPCSNQVTEVGNGLYALVLQAAETNGTALALMFSGAGCDSTILTFMVQP